jgi:mRNA-degrading endonuclease toxin of MazEF toxin-antitoxin module
MRGNRRNAFHDRGNAMKTVAAHNFHVPLPAGAYSCLRVEAERQITTLDRTKLTDKIGTLPQDTLILVEQALLAAVGILRR